MKTFLIICALAVISGGGASAQAQVTQAEIAKMEKTLRADSEAHG